MTQIPHIVVIGFGPVAARFIEEVLPQVQQHQMALTVIGAEEHSAYQRIRIADVSVGRISPEQLSLSDTKAWESSGVRLLCGVRVTALDPQQHHISLDTAEQISYDKVILATGAAAVIPAFTVEMRREGRIDSELSPQLPPQVIAMRDMEDALALRHTLGTGEPVVVLGGGVLGVESALAVAESGAQVTLVHRGPVPMVQQLGMEAGAILRAELIAAGVTVQPGCDISTVVSESGALCAVRTSTGERIPAAMLVSCTGIRPRIELAAAAGLPTARGIITSTQGRSTGEGEGHQDTFAIGDCASINGAEPAGLIAAGWEQAERAARAILQEYQLDQPGAQNAAGENVQELFQSPAAALPVILLKSKGLSVVCAGSGGAEPAWDRAAAAIPEVSTWSNPRRGQYLRILTEVSPAHGPQAETAPVSKPQTQTTLRGFIAIGLPRAAADLALYAARGALPSGDHTALIAAEHIRKESELAADDVLCRCSGATVGSVQEAAEDCCETLADIGAATRAGTGCGTCHQRIEKILQAAS